MNLCGEESAEDRQQSGQVWGREKHITKQLSSGDSWLSQISSLPLMEYVGI